MKLLRIDRSKVLYMALEVKYIRQPNHVSTARYSLTALEKNIIYMVIDELQQTMSKDINQIYHEQEVKVEFRKLDKNRNYKQIRKAMSALASKQVEFDMVIPKSGKIQKNITSLVSGLKYELYSNHISFMIPSSACAFFCYVGGGFTSFQKVIAISLKSIYSKQLYELCCRWADRGGYSCSIEKLKELLNISDKYEQISHLRHKVLEISRIELQEKGDLYFTYSLVKAKRRYETINIKIHQNVKINKEDGTFVGANQKQFSYVYLFLKRFFPDYESDKGLNYLKAIAHHQNIIRAYYRFQRLDDDFTLGKKTKHNIKNLLISTILPELTEVSDKLTPIQTLV